MISTYRQQRKIKGNSDPFHGRFAMKYARCSPVKTAEYIKLSQTDLVARNHIWKNDSFSVIIVHTFGKWPIFAQLCIL